MKRFIGRGIGFIGASMWKNGGWTGDERYEDLTITGKLGYHIFCTGLRLMGYTPEHIDAELGIQ